MNCHQTEELAALFLSGELNAQDQRAFEAHLTQCPDCDRTIEGQRFVDGKLREAYLSGSMPRGALVTAIRSGIAKPEPRVSARWLAAAAVVLAAALTAYHLGKDEPIPRLFSDAARDHREEVVRKAARHWKTSGSDIDALLASFGLAGGRKSISGSTLVRAKVCRLEGQRVLHLVYSGGGAEYSVYLLPASEGASMGQSREGPEGIAAFRNSRLRGVVVADARDAECKYLADAAARAL